MSIHTVVVLRWTLINVKKEKCILFKKLITKSADTVNKLPEKWIMIGSAKIWHKSTFALLHAKKIKSKVISNIICCTIQ